MPATEAVKKAVDAYQRRNPEKMKACPSQKPIVKFIRTMPCVIIICIWILFVSVTVLTKNANIDLSKNFVGCLTFVSFNKTLCTTLIVAPISFSFL